MSNAIRFMCDPYENPTVQDYTRTEPGSDLSFCKAWRYCSAHLLEAKPESLTSPSLLHMLDQIHMLAMEHLPEKDPVENKPLQGRAEGRTSFPLMNSPMSDLEGIRDIIFRILEKTVDFVFVIVVQGGGLIVRNHLVSAIKSGGVVVKSRLVPFEKDTDSMTLEERCAHVFKEAEKFYGKAKMSLEQVTSKEIREKRALEILDYYLKENPFEGSEEKKLHATAQLIRDLMQLHLYWEGNKRSLHLFSCSLLSLQGFSPYYPVHKGIFAASSIPKLIREIREGEELFQKEFKSIESLEQELQNYENIVKKIEIRAAIRDLFLSQAKSRDFSVLVMSVAEDPEAIPLLKLLLDHRTILNIKEIALKLAMEAANHVENHKGVELLLAAQTAGLE